MESTSSEVTIISKCFVKPKTISKKSQEPYHYAQFDYLCLPMHYMQMGLLFLKPSTKSDSHDDATFKKQEGFMETLLQKLKDSLAATLVHFYPLAGRLSAMETVETQTTTTYSVFVDCNNSPGAGFIHAKSDLSVFDIVGSKRVPLAVHSFFDHHNAMNLDGHTTSLVSLKVTELVDGVFIGLSMNHSVGDGRPFWQFFNALSEIFNSQENSVVADYTNNNNNSLFCLKNPPIFRDMSGPTCKLPFNPFDGSISKPETPAVQERMFHFSSETLRSLKRKANQECGTTTMISSLQALSAFIWRSITRARKLHNDEETTCRFMVDTRSRINPPLPTDYFGVYLSVARTTTKVGNLLENEFGWAALKLHQAITELTSEKISSDVNGLMQSPYFPLSMRSHEFSASNIVHIASSPRFNKYGPEFGMGKAVAVRSGYGNKIDGKVTSYPGREGGGSIDLEVCLLPEYMEALESDQEFMSFVSSVIISRM